MTLDLFGTVFMGSIFMEVALFPVEVCARQALWRLHSASVIGFVNKQDCLDLYSSFSSPS